MKFHTEGFVIGDPQIIPAAPSVASRTEELPSHVDVLIAGTGPAGLLLAAQLSSFPSISTRILETRMGPLQIGQADGISCKSVETFEAFDFAERIVKEAYWVNETVFWRPAENDRSTIVRTGRIKDVEEGLSEFPHIIVNQARVHDFFLEFMAHSASKLTPDYGHEILGVDITGEGTHPVTARVRTPDGSEIEVKAKYVVGTDGARSVVRSSIGRHLEGVFQNHRWGVVDVLANTNFPDFRLKAAIQSENGSNILLIPREGGNLVRLYVDLGDVDPDNREHARDMSVDEVLDVARHVLLPYTLDVKDVAWFSIYEVGHRVTDGFDELDEADRLSRTPHVFIAGDACHTHSAKAGQGMNVSMQDTFNLGWKLIAVLESRSPASLLHTYHGERHQIAHDLIDLDSAWSKVMATPPKDPAHPERPGIDPDELQAAFIRNGRFTAGMATRYRPSILTGDTEHQDVATGYPVGERFHSAPVVRLSDAKPMELGHAAKADARWRIYAFGDESVAGELAPRMMRLIDFLDSDDRSPINRFTPAGADRDAVFDVRAVLQEYHRDLNITDMPALLRPASGKFGLFDNEKVFTSDHRLGVDIFDRRGIDRAQGAIVVVRPDQYVSLVLPLDAFGELSDFFAGFMLEQ